MIIYTYPLCSAGSVVSNNSRTERLKLRFGTCSSPLGFDEEIKCGSCYCQPFIDGDKFVYQIQTDTYKVVSNLKVYSIDNIFIANVPIFTAVSIYSNYGTYSNIEFDMSVLNALAGTDCFKIQVNYADESYMSEPFCKIVCNESILICSDYNKKDCNGTIYKADVIHNASGFLPVYSNCMRLRGTLEYNGVDLENTYEEVTTTVSNRVVHAKSKINDVYELRIWGIAEWQVTRLRAVLSGLNLSINGDTYILDSGFTKGVSIGSLWYPVIKLRKTCELFNKSC